LLVTYVVFDMMVAGDASLMDRPLRHRRQVLEEMLQDVPQVRIVDQVPEHGEAMYRAALELGLEGIVAKRRDSPYRPGARSRVCLKIKRPGAVPAERFDHR
jgi:bifunctional non-homologous end joining protein LigD